MFVVARNILNDKRRESSYTSGMETPSFRHTNIPTSAQELANRVLDQHPQLLQAAQRLAESLELVSALRRYNRPHGPTKGARALIVGGFVRDAVLGLHPKDLDIEVYGMPAPILEAHLEHLFPGAINTVGKAFGIYKVAIGNGLDLDVSIPRRESKTGMGHNEFEVRGDPKMSVREAGRRRDFTMNTLAADPLTGTVIDLFGALEDLRTNTLRVTDPERFQDDPLRVYRGVQFCARMGLTPDQNTFLLMKEMVERGDLEHLPNERIVEEWKKLLLKSPKPSIGLALMRELGIIELDYPELRDLIDTPQEPEWHPEGDVWTHTLMVLDAAAKIIRRPEHSFSPDEKLQVMFGALCHDFGKPATTEIDGDRIRSRGHEEAGVEPTRAFFSRFPVSGEVERATCHIAADHLKPGVFARELERGQLNEAQYRNALRRLIKRLEGTSWRVLLAAAEADHRGRALPGVDREPYEAGRLFAETVTAYGLDVAAKTPLIQGRDLLALGLKPGREIGILVKRIEQLRDEGAIETREEALALIQNITKNMGHS